MPNNLCFIPVFTLDLHCIHSLKAAFQVLSGVQLKKSQRKKVTKLMLKTNPKQTARTQIPKVGLKKPQLQDAELKQHILPFTQETKYWSPRAGDVMRHLTCSLKDLWMACPAIHEKISLNTLSRRLRCKNSKLGISFPKSKQDLCTVCHTWDVLQRPALRQKAVDQIAKLHHAKPGCWNGWKAVLKENGWHGKQPPVDLLKFWECMMSYVQAMECDQEAKQEVLKELASCHSECKLWTCHWALRDYLKGLLQHDLSRPKPGTLYCWSDWKACWVLQF